MTEVILPGKRVGMIGGGQLGRMSILAGRQMGYTFAVLEPKSGCSASSVSDFQITAPYDDEVALSELAKVSDRITLEFENISTEIYDFLAGQVEIFPGKCSLEVCQNRSREKQFLKDNGIPCAPFSIISSAQQLKESFEKMGGAAVLKTAEFGYDGKGQVKLEGEVDFETVWAGFDSDKAVLEKWISFDGEYSVICASNGNGEQNAYPVFRNEHRNHILYATTCPSGLPDHLEKEAQKIALEITDKLEHVGVLAVEFFLSGEKWVVNEMAPRPHNSGHVTIDSHVTSQFSQHIRSVCGLPLGDPSLKLPGCMINLLGDLWVNAEPDWEEIVRLPGVNLHLYDKGEAKIGRKMGHINIVSDSLDSLASLRSQVEAILFK